MIPYRQRIHDKITETAVVLKDPFKIPALGRAFAKHSFPADTLPTKEG